LLKRGLFVKNLSRKGVFAFLKNTTTIVGVVFLMIGLLYIPVDTKNNNTIPDASASGGFQVKTGYYLGTGSPQTIDVGFEPDIVMIKSTNTTTALLWKGSGMPEENISYFIATPDNTDSTVTLTSNGFSLSSFTGVNTINILFTYIVITGSDCSSEGIFCHGSYVGDGTGARSITTGFQPDLVWVDNNANASANFRTSLMSDNHAAYFTNTSNNTNGAFIQTLNGDGFTVGASNNVLDRTYYYATFKETSSKINVGQYTGTGVSGLEIGGLDVDPAFLFIKTSNNLAPVFAVEEINDNSTFLATATTNAVNAVLVQESDYFTLGTDTRVNINGIVYNYFNFGPFNQSVPTGTFAMNVGSYVGNGTSQSITGVGFQPDLVIIKAHNANHSVFSTSLDNGSSHYMGLSSQLLANMITSLDSDGFSVSSGTAVNSDAITYEYIAYGNATTPYKIGAADFEIGLHNGNGVSPRVIRTRISSVDFIMARRRTGSNNFTVWKSSVMPAAESSYFSASTNNTTGAFFESLISNGFNIGSSLNGNGVVYIWIAFSEGPNVKMGTYNGDGVADTAITTVGFSPDWIVTKRTNNITAAQRTSSVTIVDDFSQYFTNIANTVNMITGFLSNGFQVGSSAPVNTAGGIYYYAAWKKPGTVSGTLEVNIVNESDESVVSPSMEMSLADYSDLYQTSSGNLGTSTQKIRISNTTAGPAWSVAIAASDGPTAVWDSGANSYDYNDPTAGANDGADADSVGGQMTIDPSTGTITPQSGCSTTGVSFAGEASFSEGAQDSITLVNASGSAETNCYWDITGISIEQVIPAEQASGIYELPMTITVVAS
jgi:hypothetical protein